jgi:hypothetical protein
MHARTIMALVAAAATIMTVAAASAQTADQPVRKKHSAVEQRPVVVSMRPPTRVVVRRRSYLDPGSETKPLAQHYHDYAFPADSSGSRYGDAGDFKINFNRMPFPNCFDLPGFCR